MSAAIPPHELQSAASALLRCQHRFIGVRAAGSTRNAPCAVLAHRSAASLAYALEEASALYPHAADWELIAADQEEEYSPERRMATPEALLPPGGRVLLDPVVLAQLSTGEAAPLQRPQYS